MGYGTPEHEDLGEIAALNLRRCERWHGLSDWTPAEWGLAMAGEAGEVCNAVKKLVRLEKNIQQNAGPQDREAAIKAIAQEIGDTFLYLDLLAQRLGLRTSECIRDTFNRVSEREGFPERIR